MSEVLTFSTSRSILFRNRITEHRTDEIYDRDRKIDRLREGGRERE